MKKLISLLIFSASFFCSTVIADNFSYKNYPDADRLFVWAASRYPSFFPIVNRNSQQLGKWYYRYYPVSKNYIGVDTEGNVYVAGESFGGMLYIDTFQNLLTGITELPVIKRFLNDTGLVFCANLDTHVLTCPVNDFPGQDAEYGRDVTHNDDSDGHAGFSFTKLDNNGKSLSAKAQMWACVKDNVTGLIWEVKSINGGLHDSRSTYTWYSTDNSTNGGGLGGAKGKENGGVCSGSDCDTQGYVQAVNILGLCGASDWRLPSREALRSIVDYSGLYSIMIDKDYFPYTRRTITYWSASSSALYASTSAWSVYFEFGVFNQQNKSIKGAVRLVRGGSDIILTPNLSIFKNRTGLY